MFGNVSDTTFLKSCPHAKMYEDLVENDSDAVICINEKKLISLCRLRFENLFLEAENLFVFV